MSSSNGNGKPKVYGDTKPGADGLTDKQRAFVEAFVGDAAGNASEAYRVAGFAPGADTESNAIRAYNLLQKPHIQDAVAWYASRRGLDAENAKLNLAEIGRSSMNNFLSLDAQGQPSLDFFRAAERGALGQIKKFKEIRKTTTITPKDGPPEVTETVTREIEVHDRLPAVQTILKMNGLLNEKHDHSGTIFVSDKPDPMIADPLLNKLAVQYERHLASLAGRDGEPSN